MSDDASPGWEAIEQAFSAIYGEQKPKHWGTVISWSLGGNDPLHGISAYASDKGGPHWHLVTFGLTELWEKEKESDPTISGYGFELTMRLARAPHEQEPPPWVLNFLQNIGRYVFTTGRTFSVGDHMNCNGPIALERTTKIHAFCCVADADLPDEIPSPNGAFRFVQLYGITLAELAEIVAWNTDRIVGHLRRRDPVLVTDLARDDFHGDAALLDDIRAASAKEPSSTGLLYISPLTVTHPRSPGQTRRLTVGAMMIESLIRLVRKRLGFGKELILTCDGRKVVLKPGTDADSDAIIQLDESECRTLTDSVHPRAGVYPLSPHLEIEVVRSEIKDNQGRVVSTVG